MKTEHMFLFLTAIYIAPHIDRKIATLFSALCLCAAIVFSAWR